ncbi:MAG: type 4a pilus biogenesis protein PilO [Parcubacteria group bacterium]|nr:type 4a pilus biogenesis protein PilO [Parcubacteria group bacterium]
MPYIIFTIALLVASGGVFFGFTDERYAVIQGLEKEKEELARAAEKMNELNEVRDAILARRASFSSEDIERLEKALPDNVDNIRLINDLDGIASQYNMLVRGASVSFAMDASGDIIVDENEYGVVTVQFSVSGPYQTFLNFLDKLEHSLRIVDVTSISFSSSEEDFYEYGISLQTYWLR